VSVWRLLADEAGLRREAIQIGGTPAWVYRLEGSDPAPVVIVAHGFAGSRRLMEPLALALAGRGYVALTYDFLGHGRHPLPMRGDLETSDAESTTAYLLRQTDEVVRAATTLTGGDGRLALVGHSMATDILVRYAQDGVGLGGDGAAAPPSRPSPHTGIAATVGISMFAPTVDSTSPRNLMAIAGEWEARLTAEGRRVVAMVAGVDSAGVRPFRTYGDPRAGTGRRLAIAPHVEHVGVLYSSTTLEETVAWLDQALPRDETVAAGETAGGGRWLAGGDEVVVGAQQRTPRAPGEVRGRGRGLWIALLMAAVFLLARPLSGALPRVSVRPLGAGASWRRLLLVTGVPALATPPILRPLPTSFLPVVVADYVAVHFLMVGILSGALLWWTGGRPGIGEIVRSATDAQPGRGVARTLVGAALTVDFFLLLVALPLDRFFTSFVPVAGRIPLLLAVLVGTLPYFLADEWMTRGANAPRGAYAATKVLFLVSLSLAVALDFEGLFFLVLIIPLIVVFFGIHGLLSRWAYRATGSPLVAGLANAFAFAWALAVTFPLYAGP
jgi:hypothetical protein